MALTDVSSPRDPRALWSARVEWLSQMTWTHAVTLAYNDWPIRRDRIRHDLHALQGMIDRRLFGTRFHQRPVEQRTRYIAFLEGEDHHPHLHAGWYVPPGPAWFEFVRLFEGGLWQRFAPRGSFFIRIMESPTIWWSYSTKYMNDDDDWFCSDAARPPAAS